jgi:hypothetical protein
MVMLGPCVVRAGGRVNGCAFCCFGDGAELWFGGGRICGHIFGLEALTAATRQADATLQQAELARRGHVAELFNHAVGQLTDAKLEVRLGAIYTLRQIARDFPDLAEPTLELLSSYLRESAGKYEGDEPPIDVREIMKTLRDHLVLK